MKSHWLVLNRDEKVKKVMIIDSIDGRFNQYRISPIFPIASNYILPNFDKKIFIQFFFTKNPFTILVEILRLFKGSEIEKKIWISHGLASIIYITEDTNGRNEILNLFEGPDAKDEFKHDIIAVQEWKLDKNILDPESTILIEPNQPSVEISLEDYSKLPSDLRNDIIEFASCIKTAIQRSKIYTPHFTDSFELLIDEINKIIIQLNYLFNPESILPEMLSTREVELKDKTARLILLNELTEEIIQINSALSYIISQGYAGVVPIEENPCPLYAYSLLGIGTAHKGLTSFYRYISNVFSRNPVDLIIEKYYDRAISPKIFRIDEIEYIREWKKWGIDKFRRIGPADADEDQFQELLVYFSCRHGFSESMFSISAAIQSLYLGITSRWSIITSTHEIMHSHVRGIYYYLQERLKELPKSQIKNFLANPEDGNLGLSDWLSLVMLNFADNYMQYKEKIGRKNVGKLDNHEKIPLSISNDFRLAAINLETIYIINEIMTHTLDFYYFYEGDPEIYIKQIWMSWANLPTTQQKVEEYVLRSVCAIATLDQESDSVMRIRDACETTRDILRKLIDIDNSINSEIYREAIRKLERSEERPHNFELLLTAGLYLADATRCFIYSQDIQLSLFLDPTKKKVEDDKDDVPGLDYALEPGMFEGESITNPVSFILSCVRRSISKRGDQEFELDKYQTLWLYFICSSLNNEQSGLDVSN